MNQNYSTGLSRAFWLALALNFVWINASEIWRYFYVIKPMLNATFSSQPEIGAMSLPIFASWAVWDLVLVIAATGFFWLWLAKFQTGVLQVFVASAAFTVTVFGLLWFGLANMGFVPLKFLWVALPLAWGENIVAAFLTLWAINRSLRRSNA